VLVGVTHDDDPTRADRLAERIWNLRVMDDERSAANLSAPVLVVSQFTLYADLSKGRRPSWSAAAPRAVSEPLVDAFAEALRRRGAVVETGRFGADMAVTLVNDGPRTIIVES
jgi:D-aminoacyl-tRNA deacylase